MIRRSILAQAVIYAALLSACGDGGNGDTPIPIDPALQVGGIWNGTTTATITQPGSSGPVLLQSAAIQIFTTEPDLITGMSQFRLVSDFAWQAKGEIAVTEGINNQEDDKLEGGFTAFAPDGFVFSDGARTATCNLTGIFMETIGTNFQEIKSMNGSYTCLDKDDPSTVIVTGAFTVDYDATLYEQPSSIFRIAGDIGNSEDWCGPNFATTNNECVLDLNFFNAGTEATVSGIDDVGCEYNGQIGIIDPAFNLYDISLTISECPFVDGAYTGLATLKPGIADAADQFTYQIDNGSIIVTQPVFRFPPPAP